MSSVNRPVDLKQKEKDVNNKLQTLRHRRGSPLTDGSDVALNSALAHRALNSPSKKLSSEGQHLVSDLKSVIEQAKILLLTKNEGNLLQDFIWQAEHLGSDSASLPNAPVDKDHSKATWKRGARRPSEDRLNRLDEPAEDNTWHDTSDLNRENLHNQAKNSLPFGNKNKDEAKSDLRERAKDINQAAGPKRSAPHEGQTGQSTGINARGALETAKQKVDANTSEEDKNMARARRDQMNNYLKGKMPEERHEQTIWRLKKMVVEIQGHQGLPACH
ncbi:unnamed protein product [Alternaria alternata]